MVSSLNRCSSRSRVPLRRVRSRSLAAAWLAGPTDVAGLPVLLLTAGVVSSPHHPALNAWSRRNEHRADRFALELTERPDAFVSAMRRLAAQNLAEERPSATTLWLFHTLHPSNSAFRQRARSCRRPTSPGRICLCSGCRRIVRVRPALFRNIIPHARAAGVAIMAQRQGVAIWRLAPSRPASAPRPRSTPSSTR